MEQNTQDLLKGFKMPKISKGLIFILTILVIFILCLITIVSPLILVYFLARFYHLRRLAYMQKSFVLETKKEDKSTTIKS